MSKIHKINEDIKKIQEAAPKLERSQSLHSETGSTDMSSPLSRSILSGKSFVENIRKTQDDSILIKTKNGLTL